MLSNVAQQLVETMESEEKEKKTMSSSPAETLPTKIIDDRRDF